MAGTGSRVSQMGQHQLTHWITEGGWIPGQLAEDPKASQSWFWSALGWGRGTGAGADVLCWLCPNKVGCRAAVVLGLVSATLWVKLGPVGEARPRIFWGWFWLACGWNVVLQISGCMSLGL